MIKPKTPCPCGSDLSYEHCCLALHQGQAATTPEALMRSRYVAYLLRLDDYLLSSWHPDTRPRSLDLQDSPKWVRLKIIKSTQEGDRGSVHFKAFYRSSRGMQTMEEESNFVRQQGHWLYLDGSHP